MTNHSEALPEITIRSAVATDAASMAAIFLDARSTQYTAEVYKTLLADSNLMDQFNAIVHNQDNDFKCWVAVTPDGEILGYSATQRIIPTPDLLLQSKVGYVSTYIKRSSKASGLGTRLFTHNMNYCRFESNIEYVLGLQYRGNPASVSITDNAGFEVMGEFDKLTGYPPMSIISWHSKHE